MQLRYKEKMNQKLQLLNLKPTEEKKKQRL